MTKILSDELIITELRACRDLPANQAACAIMKILDQHYRLVDGKVPQDRRARRGADGLHKYYSSGGRHIIHSIHRIMKKAFRVLGQGAFSTVYGFGRKWVIKINDVDYYASGVDTWVHWAVACSKNQDNPFLPKIASIEKKNLLLVTVMERLTEGKRSMSPGSYATRTFVSASLDKRKTADVISSTESSEILYMLALDKDNAIKLGRLLGGVLKKSDCSRLDVHDENVMARGIWPVVTDPISNGEIISLGPQFARKKIQYSNMELS